MTATVKKNNGKIYTMAATEFHIRQFKKKKNLLH